MGKSAWAVIGAGYGDEGKGLMVDALADAIGPEPVVVVRTNGGAQAGHTVVTPDGRRHVFHHVGSGALAGAASHLSRWFVHHPMVLGGELDALVRLGACTTITADPRGYVATPWDMLVNQVIERTRGDGRHGSCGYGFGETVGRCEETPHRLTVGDLATRGLRGKLAAIRNDWAPARLAALGISRLDDEDRYLLGSAAVLERFAQDCAAFLDRVRIAPDARLGHYGWVIFEGAQGLMLDQHHGAFPHVTRSSTGLANMLAVAGEAGIDWIDALYVTRCYLTRHGRGPMPNECDVSAAFAVDDRTNMPNPWQETLRFGELDLDVLAEAVRRDLALAEAAACEVAPHLAVTCLDQARGPIPYRVAGARTSAEPSRFVAAAASSCRARGDARSSGPTRATVDLAGVLAPHATADRRWPARQAA